MTSGDEDTDNERSSDEPTEARERVGDLRHQGERVHDKASELGLGTPGKPGPYKDRAGERRGEG